MILIKVKLFIKRITWIFFLLIILYIMQHFINFLSYDYSGPSKYFVKYFSFFGIEEETARMILWYIVQIAITLICLKLLFKQSIKELGFNLQDSKKGSRYIFFFIIIFTLIVAIGWLIIYKIAGINILTEGIQKKSISYIIKDLLAYGLLPGIGEEPLFRVLIIQVLLLTVFKEKDLRDKNTKIWIILISAMFFVYGHIYIKSWIPLIINYNVIQLFTAFALGIFYAILYIKTKSILTAVVCHNYSDFIVRIGHYILFYIFIK